MRATISPAVHFVQHNYLHTLLLLFSAIVFTYWAGNSHVRGVMATIMPWLLLALSVTAERNIRIALLAVITIMLAFTVFSKYYIVANHGFFITYLSIALVIGLSSRGSEERTLRLTGFVLLACLMGVALLQKLASEYYLSGNLMGEYLLTGAIFKNIVSVFIPDWPAIVASNEEARNTLNSAGGFAAKPETIIIPSGIMAFAYVLTYGSLMMQFLLEAALFFRRQLGIYLHFILLGTVALIYSTVNENVFLSMNLFLGYALTEEKHKKIRVVYVLFIFYLLVMKLYGLRPPVIS